MIPRERLIVALDVSSATQAQRIVSSLGDSVRAYKIGMQLYTAAGPQIVRDLIASGKEVFLDLKYHDIPNTVAAAVREAAQLGVSMLTVHASGGGKMLRAAVQAAREPDEFGDTVPARTDVLSPDKQNRGGAGVLARTEDDLKAVAPNNDFGGAGVAARTNIPARTKNKPLILAVTILTSMDTFDLRETGIRDPVLDQVVRLASIALDAGCDGLVSSAHEVKALRAKFGDGFLAITPGVRPAGADHGDQARVVTPADALAAGATCIVVGRPITAAADPARATREILDDLESSQSRPISR